MDITKLSFLNSLIRKESIRAVEAILESKKESDEKQKQRDMSKAVSKRGLNSSDKKSVDVEEAETEENSGDDSENKKREDRTGGKGTPDSKKANTPAEKSFKNPSLVDFVNKINVLRGGQSVESPDIKKAFSSYLDSLSISEKRSMLVFLTAVSQIMVGKKKGADALDPEEAGVKTSIDKKQKIKQTKSPDSKVGTEKVPIVVGENADKRYIQSILKKYREMK